MIEIIKGRQREYKTTYAVAKVVDLVLNGGYATIDVVSNIHLFRPRRESDGNLPALNVKNLADIQPERVAALQRHCDKYNVVELEEYHYLKNKQMRLLMQKIVQTGIEHKIVLMDEIDRLFSHLHWMKEEHQEALLGLWQDEKLFNWFIGTAHIGTSVNKLIRESMQYETFTRVEVKGKSVGLDVITSEHDILELEMVNVERTQQLFYSWEPVS